ncbi:polysaccharide deacetylase family protein [Limosilactobacillus reuteri]|uniref:polysaccharide deacetylase family protein n=1 Tax=Limosilactobacillus reuteri TaxID=1598 RepID=UPI00214AF100|nr:polysaccharide deacetylase family protein [Limosilactobacillus reuteri]MCR1862533.1 polysaccharide deacetylase family protein [Limosilactobacillus reuteri]MCR1893067.1 polysaccharide deacetylase family protein [Limosilactobacillus reuteri]
MASHYSACIRNLKKYHIPVTFMIWGEHAEKYPELLKEEAKCLLFTLGNHTYHHKDLTKSSIKEGKNEIAKNDEVIEKLQVSNRK